MKSLEDFNKKRNNLYVNQGKPYLNGIECPKCGEELWDTNPNVTLTSMPPQKNIGCKNCDYKGYRVA